MPTLEAQGIVPVQPAAGDRSPLRFASTSLRSTYTGVVNPPWKPPGISSTPSTSSSPPAFDALRSFPYERAISKERSPVRNFFSVGPLVHDAYLRLLNSEAVKGSSFIEPEASYLQWLNRQPVDSVLYVNFGSIVSLSIRQIHELAMGLEASKQRFLLVVRPSSVKDSLEDLSPLPEGFSAHTREIGFVQSELVNQLGVLSHPAVGGFLIRWGGTPLLRAAVEVCLSWHGRFKQIKC